MTHREPRGVPLLVVAGEASGDLHGAHLLAELAKLRDDLLPFGMGGSRMQSLGLEAVADVREVAVVGITEVARMLPRIRRVFWRLVEEAEARGVKTAVLIDFPDFNLRLAKQLKKRGIEVVYFVSPQIWAWRKGRVKTIARTVAEMLVLFPFEVDFYLQAGVPVECVGHPLVEEVPVRSELPQPPVWKPPYRVAVLPGSRESEVAALLPVMLAAMAEAAKHHPIRATLVQAPTLDRAYLESYLGDGFEVPVEIVDDDRFAQIANCHLALCASGTATLEVGLTETPLIVVYRLGRGSYWLAKMLVDLPHISLVNLVLGRGVVPEHVQEQANAQALATSMRRWIEDPAEAQRVRSDLSSLRSALGESGASRKAALAVARYLEPAFDGAQPSGSTVDRRADGESLIEKDSRGME